MLLAVGAVHHHLIRIGKRMRAWLVCETGEARDVHQMACLIGYGAAAICPYVAFETCREVLEKTQAATAAEAGERAQAERPEETGRCRGGREDLGRRSPTYRA